MFYRSCGRVVGAIKTYRQKRFGSYTNGFKPEKSTIYHIFPINLILKKTHMFSLNLKNRDIRENPLTQCLLIFEKIIQATELNNSYTTSIC